MNPPLLTGHNQRAWKGETVVPSHLVAAVRAFREWARNEVRRIMSEARERSKAAPRRPVLGHSRDRRAKTD